MQATTVAALGEAETNYNLAGFNVSLSSIGGTVPTAKAKLKIQVDALMKALEAMKEKLSLEFVKNSVRSNSNVQEKYEWVKNSNEFKGYEASYNYFFQIDQMDKVSEVYDILTSLEEATISSPHYELKTKDRDKVNKKALKHAFEKVSERFETECKVFGLDPSDFEIVSWEASYSDSRRGSRVAAATRSAAARMNVQLEAAVALAASDGGSSSEPLELVVGLASVTVNLEVGYGRKPSQTLKATVVKEAGSRSVKKENEHV